MHADLPPAVGNINDIEISELMEAILFITDPLTPFLRLPEAVGLSEFSYVPLSNLRSFAYVLSSMTNIAPERHSTAIRFVVWPCTRVALRKPRIGGLSISHRSLIVSKAAGT